MTRSSDSGDDHQAVQKNGKDQSQDRGIRDLYARAERNDQDHGRIMNILDDVKLSSENIRGDIRGSKMVAIAIGTIFAATTGIAVWMLDRSMTVIDRIDARTIEVDKAITKHEAWGIERSNVVTDAVNDIRQKHEHDIDEVHQDIKELDRRERQRGK